MLSDANVYVDGVGLSALRRARPALGGGEASFGGGVRRGGGHFGGEGRGGGRARVGGAVEAGRVCGHVVGRGPSKEPARRLPLGAVGLPAWAFCGGYGSLGLYCGSGDPTGDRYGELVAVECDFEELVLLAELLRPGFGRTRASCV